MTSKNKTIVSLAVLMFLAITSILVSAVSFNPSPSSITFNPSSDSTTFTLIPTVPNNPINVSFTLPTIKNQRGEIIPISISPTSLTNFDSNAIITLNADIDYKYINLGESYTGNLLIKNSNDASDNKTVQVKIEKTYCEYGKQGSGLEITRLKDRSTGVEDDWEWRPLDKISVELKVSNRADDDLDVVINLGLYDAANDEFIDLGDDDELEEEITIDEDESEIIAFEFELPVDIEEGDYQLYVKVYEEGNEEEECIDNIISTSYSQEVRIEKESHDVVVSSIDGPDTIQCGEEVEYRLRVSNIGTKDQEQVRVDILNSALKISEKSLGFELDSEDTRTLTMYVRIPQNATEGFYDLDLISLFDYKESLDDYRESSDAKKFRIKVEGCQPVEQKNVQISAELNKETPEVRAGKQVIIDGSITNTGNVATTYTISVTGNALWSELSAIDPNTLTLSPGQIGSFDIYLDVDSDVIGEKEFTIKADYGTGFKEQKIALEVQEGIGTSVIAEHLRENWFIYAIVIINLILIIAIIIVVIRIAFRKKSSN